MNVHTQKAIVLPDPKEWFPGAVTIEGNHSAETAHVQFLNAKYSIAKMFEKYGPASAQGTKTNAKTKKQEMAEAACLDSHGQHHSRNHCFGDFVVFCFCFSPRFFQIVVPSELASYGDSPVFVPDLPPLRGCCVVRQGERQAEGGCARDVRFWFGDCQ